MKILLKPSDIIERALWQKYEFFVLEDVSQDKIEKMIVEDEEFEIPERDALVIELLKCIETDNLIHRLNQKIIHTLSIKSNEVEVDKNKKTLAIRKNLIIDELNKFRKNFPKSWKPASNYKQSRVDLIKYIHELLKKVDKAKIIIVEFQGNEIEHIQLTHVKKMLKLNH